MTLPLKSISFKHVSQVFNTELHCLLQKSTILKREHVYFLGSLGYSILNQLIPSILLAQEKDVITLKIHNPIEHHYSYLEPQVRMQEKTSHNRHFSGSQNKNIIQIKMKDNCPKGTYSSTLKHKTERDPKEKFLVLCFLLNLTLFQERK